MSTAKISTVKAFVGTKPIKLQQHVQSNILQQIMAQKEHEPFDQLDSAQRSLPNPPHLGSNVDAYI